MKTVFREARNRDAQFKGAQTEQANVHGAFFAGKDNSRPAC